MAQPVVLELVIAVAAGALFVVAGRRIADRAGARALLRHRARVDRFKLASRAHVRAELLQDGVIAEAVREHALEHGVPSGAAWRRVREYVDEIVPFFNVLAYFRVGMSVARATLNVFYKVT